MRLPTRRGGFEWSARLLALAALAALLVRAWSPPASELRQSTHAADLEAGLPRWTLEDRPLSLDLRLERVPTREEREWIAALRHAGATVSWSGELPALAVTVASSAEPFPSRLVRAAAPAGERLELADDARSLSSGSSDGLLSLRASMSGGAVYLHSANSKAFAATAPPPRLGRIAVLGPAGWESKFVVAALEERGWDLDVSMRVAPGVIVGRFDPAMLDTARHSAVVLLDEADVPRVPGLARFARSGGGVVLAGTAAAARSLTGLAPVANPRPLQARDTTIVDREALSGSSFATLLDGSAVIETRDERPVIVGMRAGAGRVLSAGYADTWRWRMLGEHGPEAHRDWWSAVVGSVAYAVDTAATPSADPAPLAAWVAAAGPASGGAAPRWPGRQLPIEALLFALVSGALLAEVVSRRRRGLR